MNDKTISRGWREKGNISYKNFVDSNCPERQKNYLESASRLYYRAYETAEGNQDKSSAAKNCAMAALHLTGLCLFDGGTTLCEFRFHEAIGYFSKVMLICQVTVEMYLLIVGSMFSGVHSIQFYSFTCTCSSCCFICSTGIQKQKLDYDISYKLHVQTADSEHVPTFCTVFEVLNWACALIYTYCRFANNIGRNMLEALKQMKEEGTRSN